MIQQFTYTACCKSCHGEGTTQEAYPSMGGVGGMVLVDRACYACKGTGAGDVITVQYCDVCDSEECPGCEPAPVPVAATATAPVVFLDGIVDAPGFTTATFAAGVAKAQRLGTVHMEPGFASTVLVTSPTSGGRYAVRRQDCTCKAGQTHGYCWHRAAVLYTHDVCGINVSRERVLGFDEAGSPVTDTATAAQLQEAA